MVSRTNRRTLHSMRSSNPRTFNTSASPNIVNDPIWPATKGKKGKKRENVFYDDRGFPDQSEGFDYLLHRTGGGKVIRKRLHPAPSLDKVDQKFNTPFDEKKHGEKLRRELKVDHLPPDLQKDLTELIKKYWPVFDDNGLFIPVKDYECIIDTGSARPICVKNINYGPCKTHYMEKCIAALESWVTSAKHTRVVHVLGDEIYLAN